MFSQDVTIAWAPPSTRKSSLLVHQLLRSADRQNVQAVALVKSGGNDVCLSYEEAMRNLHAIPNNTVLILDEADTLDTVMAACLMKIAATSHRIILIVSFVESGRALATFLRPAATPHVMEWDEKAVPNAPDVKYMPQYHDDAVQAAVHFAGEQEDYTVVIFAGSLRIAKAIVSELDYAIVVHDKKPAPQQLEKNRVVVVTDAGQDFMTSEYLTAHSVIDTGIAIGSDDRGTYYQGIITRFESARRIGRALHTCICFYDPSMLTPSTLMSTHRVQRVRALCMAGGMSSPEIQGALDWRPAMRECVGRGFLSYDGSPCRIGIAMANLGMDACLVHFMDEAMRLGFVQRGAVFAVMIHAHSLQTQPVDAVLRPCPGFHLSKAEHRTYANIMTVFGQSHTFPAYIPEREVFVDAVARCMHNHKCIRLEGPWYYSPFLRRLLRTQHPLSETNDITCLVREGNKIQSFVILPTTSTTAILSIPAEGIPGLERYVYVHRNIMGRRGIYVTCRRKDVVRVICVPGLKEAHRDIVTSWINALRVQKTLAPKEIKTEWPEVCLVVSNGGRVTDVTLKNEKVSIVLPHFKDMTRYLPEYSRIAPNENGTVKITVHTREQLHALFEHCEIAGIDAATTRANRRPPSSIRLKIRLCFSWAVGESHGKAVVTKIPQSMEEWTEKLPHTVSVTPERHQVVLQDIPRVWDERDVSEILGVDSSAVTIRRGKSLGGKLLPTTVHNFIDAVRRAHPTTAKHSDFVTEHGVRMLFVDIPSTDAVSFVIQSQQRIIPPTILNQRTRAWIKIEAIPHSINPTFWDQLTRSQDTAWTVDVNHIPGSNEDTFQEFIGVFTAIDQLQQIAEPLVFYDPSLCHLRSIPRVAPSFVERVGIATVHIYGPEPQRVIKILQDRAAKSCRPPELTCEICFTAYPDYMLTACCHRFCSECMCHTVNACAGQQLPFLCPATDCREPMAWDNVEELCCPNKMTMWKQQQVRSLAVRRPDLIRLCPGCDSVIETRSPPNSYNCTSCKTTWCLSCSSMAGEATRSHKGPCNAKERYEELAKLKDAGVYPCPSCFTPIVKTEGCSHVKCDMRDCRAHFCWLCMQQFSPIHSYRVQSTLHSTVGVIEFINYEEDTAVVKIIPDTWKVQCPLPANETLILKFSYLQPVVMGAELETWTKVIVETEIYEHIAQCGRPVNS